MSAETRQALIVLHFWWFGCKATVFRMYCEPRKLLVKPNEHMDPSCWPQAPRFVLPVALGGRNPLLLASPGLTVLNATRKRSLLIHVATEGLQNETDLPEAECPRKIRKSSWGSRPQSSSQNAWTRNLYETNSGFTGSSPATRNWHLTFLNLQNITCETIWQTVIVANQQLAKQNTRLTSKETPPKGQPKW